MDLKLPRYVADQSILERIGLKLPANNSEELILNK